MVLIFLDRPRKISHSPCCKVSILKVKHLRLRKIMHKMSQIVTCISKLGKL